MTTPDHSFSQINFSPDFKIILFLFVELKASLLAWSQSIRRFDRVGYWRIYGFKSIIFISDREKIQCQWGFMMKSYGGKGIDEKDVCDSGGLVWPQWREWEVRSVCLFGITRAMDWEEKSEMNQVWLKVCFGARGECLSCSLAPNKTLPHFYSEVGRKGVKWRKLSDKLEEANIKSSLVWLNSKYEKERKTFSYYRDGKK